SLPRILTRLVLASALAGGLSPSLATAQQPPRAMTRPVEPDAQPMKKGRVGEGEEAAGEQPDGLVPSSGVELYRRMGTELPPLPEEKPYEGPVDEAFGAYQRGLYVTALAIALPRAEAGDAAAQTLVAEMMTKGLGIRRDAKTAAFWYGQAAERGDPAAMFRYALLLMTGRHVERDKAKA